MCDDRDKTVVTEMSERRVGGGKRGFLKLNGKLCSSIKTRGGDIKSYTPVPGGQDAGRGDAMEGDSSIRIPGSLFFFFFCRAGV